MIGSIRPCIVSPRALPVSVHGIELSAFCPPRRGWRLRLCAGTRIEAGQHDRDVVGPARRERGVEQPLYAGLIVLLDAGADRVVVDFVGEAVAAQEPS